MVEKLEPDPESGSGDCNKTVTGQPGRFTVIKSRYILQGTFTRGRGHDWAHGSGKAFRVS